MFLIVPLLPVIFLLPINKKIKSAFIVSVFTIITIIRYGFGADYFSYAYLYENMSIESIYHIVFWNKRFEPLFLLFISSFKYLGFSYSQMLSMVGLILYFLTLIWIKRNSNNFLESVIVFISMFYLVWTISALRQSVVLIGAMYLLFDKKQYNLKTKIFGILILSQFHTSALYLFLIVLFNKYDFSKNNIFIMMFVSVLISIIPIYEIINFIPFIPFKSKILYYFTPGISFLNFGYLVRLSFTILFLYFYDYLILINKKMLHNILFGFATYFALSFARILAGRLGIYTYFLLILFLPEVLVSFNIKYKEIGFIMFLSLFFTKEVDAVIKQSAIETKFRIPTIFTKSQYSFNKYDYFLLERANATKELRNSFFEELKDMQIEGYGESDYNFAGWNPHIHGYSIYNNSGKLSVDYPMRGSPRIYKDILVNYYDIDLLFPEKRYIDLSPEKREKDILVSEYYSYLKETEFYENITSEQIQIKFEELPQSTIDIFKYKSQIKNFSVYKFIEPNTYHIVKINYYYDTLYLYLDENLEPLNGLLFDNPVKFDQTSTLQNIIRGQKIRINDRGKVIWVELYD